MKISVDVYNGTCLSNECGTVESMKTKRGYSAYESAYSPDRCAKMGSDMDYKNEVAMAQ